MCQGPFQWPLTVELLQVTVKVTLMVYSLAAEHRQMRQILNKHNFFTGSHYQGL